MISTMIKLLRDKHKMTILKGLLAFLLSIWVALSGSVQLLLMLMAFDFATGLGAGVIKKELDSSISYRGLIKKTMMLILVAVVHLIMRPLHLGFDAGAAVALFYCANEAISITENCARADVPVPKWLIDILVKARSKAAPTGREGQLSGLER